MREYAFVYKYGTIYGIRINKNYILDDFMGLYHNLSTENSQNLYTMEFYKLSKGEHVDLTITSNVARFDRTSFNIAIVR